MRVKIPVSDLKPNTFITNDVYNENFQLIITSGTLLTAKILNRLKLFNVEYVYIDKPDANAPQTNSFTQTKEFIEFKEDFMQVSDGLEKSLKNLVENNLTEDDFQDTLNSCVDLCGSSFTSYGLFDMLHHMRDFSDTIFVHSINVGIIASIIGKWAGKSEADEKLLMACGLFHDIGKLLIPKEILDKPGKLTEEEFEIVKTHTSKAYEMVKDSPLDERIKKCILMHHEKINGSGYPQGLKGDEIDDFAKIIAIADVYDALTSTRAYRGPICPFDVLELFEQDGFHYYDTRYLLTFLQNIINSYLHTQVVLSNGAQGEIIMVNTHNYSKPIVHSDEGFIDLSKEKDIKIEKILEE